LRVAMNNGPSDHRVRLGARSSSLIKVGKAHKIGSQKRARPSAGTDQREGASSDMG
jgi:hypothetical protein